MRSYIVDDIQIREIEVLSQGSYTIAVPALDLENVNDCIRVQ